MSRTSSSTESSSTTADLDVCIDQPPPAEVPAATLSPTPSSANSAEPFDEGFWAPFPSPAPDGGVPWQGPLIPASELQGGRAAQLQCLSPGDGEQPKPVAPPALQLHSRGPAVVALQRALVEAGQSVGSFGADGGFGDDTEKAVRAFQKAHPPLEETGLVDAKTWAELEKAAPASLKDGVPKVEDAFPHTADGTPMMRQNDARWGARPIGAKPPPPQAGVEPPKPKTIGGAGCLLTSLAMVLSKRLGRAVTPDQLNDVLLRSGAFAGAMIGNWNTAEKALAAEYGVALGVNQTQKRDQAGPELAATVDAELAAGRPVILWVDTEGDGPRNHFVVAQRKVQGPDGKDEYVIIDPAYGSEFRYQLDEKGFRAKDAYYRWRTFDDDGKVKATGMGTPVASGVVVFKQ